MHASCHLLHWADPKQKGCHCITLLRRVFTKGRSEKEKRAKREKMEKYELKDYCKLHFKRENLSWVMAA